MLQFCAQSETSENKELLQGIPGDNETAVAPRCNLGFGYLHSSEDPEMVSRHRGTHSEAGSTNRFIFSNSAGYLLTGPEARQARLRTTGPGTRLLPSVASECHPSRRFRVRIPKMTRTLASPGSPYRSNNPRDRRTTSHRLPPTPSYPSRRNGQYARNVRWRWTCFPAPGEGSCS